MTRRRTGKPPPQDHIDFCQHTADEWDRTRSGFLWRCCCDTITAYEQWKWITGLKKIREDG